MKRNAISTLSLAVMLASSAYAQPVSGDVLYDTDFTGTSGTPMPGWTVYTGGDNTALINNNEYRLSRVTGGSSIHSFYTDDDSSEWDNYRIETVFRSNWADRTTTYVGLIARWDGTDPITSGPAGGYYAFVNYRDGGETELVIWKGFGNGQTTSYAVASETFEYTLKNATTWNDPYYLTLEVYGPTITFTFSDGSFSKTLTYVDEVDPYLQGAPGVRSHFGTNGRNSEYGYFTVTQVIPEPSTSALLAGAFVMGAAVLCRRRVALRR